MLAMVFWVLFGVPALGGAALYTLYLFHENWRAWMWEDGFRLAMRGDGSKAIAATLACFALPLVNVLTFYALVRAWIEWRYSCC